MSAASVKLKSLESLLTSTKDSMTVPYNQTLLRAVQLFKINKAHHLVVMKEDKPIGILMKESLFEYCYDILKKTTGLTETKFELAYHKIEDLEQLISPVLHTSDDLPSALDRLLNTKFFCMPVVDDNDQLLGILSCKDIIEGYLSGKIQIPAK
ncbi:MAG: CBS domain-containing protein [Bacteroidia bacterium]|nr:CBS domain-containing protein [Bacteroidia bacterium]